MCCHKWLSVTFCHRTNNQQKQPPEVFCKKSVLRNFAKFTGKYLCQSLFFNKVAGLMPTTLLKKRLWPRCFPANFTKLLRKPFSQNTSGRLLLNQFPYRPTLRSKIFAELNLIKFNKNATPARFKINFNLYTKSYFWDLKGF